MELTIKYFGMLADITACREEIIDFEGGTSTDLIDTLCFKYPSLKNTSFKIAQNQDIIQNNEIVSAKEIVLLPPFSGG